ncbi:hypothetical protein EMIT0357P_110188 [Pseudomonas marginalis]
MDVVFRDLSTVREAGRRFTVRAFRHQDAPHECFKGYSPRDFPGADVSRLFIQGLRPAPGPGPSGPRNDPGMDRAVVCRFRPAGR